MNRRGFFFTVMALILLSFIFISVQLWAQTTQAQEQRYAQRFGTYAMQDAISMASEQSLADFVNASMVHAVDKFATSLENNPTIYLHAVYDTRDKASNDPNSYPNDPEGIYYLNKSIYELMVYGNTSGYLTNAQNSWPPSKYFYDYTTAPAVGGSSMSVRKNLTYEQDEMRYTLGYYFSTTGKAAQIIGYNISWGKPKNFTLNQTDAWTMHVHLEVPVNFSDSQGRLQTSKNVSVDASFDIDGLSDPYLARANLEYNREIGVPLSDIFDPYTLPHRNIYHIPEYEERADAQAQALKDGSEGLGWFFGPAVQASQLPLFSKDNYRFNSSKISSYILVTSSAALAKEWSGSFGAIMLVRPATEWETVRTINVYQNGP
ncbi:MAG: hypothetical protein V1822_01085, partial [Candidatus Micrarchaeota archaeon]